MLQSCKAAPPVTDLYHDLFHVDAYNYGWNYAALAVDPMVLEWRLRGWSRVERATAIRGYVDRRQAYQHWDQL
jgi:hypothetical protein